MHHDGPICAALGHFVGTLTVIYCPHTQAWIMVWSAGDDNDDMLLDHGQMEFGPFDSSDDVARRAASFTQKLVRVDARRWLAQRTGEELSD